MKYPDWQKLENIVNSDDSALKDIASKYPQEIMRWVALVKRNGKGCPMSRGVLKQLCFYEAKNIQFRDNVDSGKWTNIFS